MIGLVFVMHGILGETLKGELEHVVGPQGQATVFLSLIHISEPTRP